MNEVVQSTLKEYRIEPDQISVSCPSLSRMILSSSYLLKMILGCVVENAVQYGGEAVRVKIDLKETPDSLQVSIQDNGAGIDLAYQKPVFDMFFRAHEKSTGNGLGLYLVKLGMEKLGGQVKLHSSLGVGTEIKLTILKPINY